MLSGKSEKGGKCRGGYSGEGSEGALHLILGVKTSIINLMTQMKKKYNNNIVKCT